MDLEFFIIDVLEGLRPKLKLKEETSKRSEEEPTKEQIDEAIDYNRERTALNTFDEELKKMGENQDKPLQRRNVDIPLPMLKEKKEEEKEGIHISLLTKKGNKSIIKSIVVQPETQLAQSILKK